MARRRGPARRIGSARTPVRPVRPPAGSRPGTLAAPADSPAPRIHVTTYAPDGVQEREIGDVEELTRSVDPERTAWIDVRGLGDERVLRRIGEIFGLHPLALEDAVNASGRAKSELYPDHQLVIARLPVLDGGAIAEVPQVALLIGRHHLLTFQERSFGCFDPVRVRLREGVPPIRGAGPAYLAYALIDTVVDRYYPVVESLTLELEDLEEDVIHTSPGAQLLERIHRSRRHLVVLRRVVRPQREALLELATTDSPFVPPEVRTFLRDTHDHVAQVVELADSAHELSVALLELYRSSLGQRTNETMKLLTMIGSIFIPLSFVAGLYGMNFEYMPGLHRPWGYLATLAGMGAVAAGMLLYFRHRGWIGRGRGR